MQVTLIDYTGKGMPSPADYAAGVLIFAKSTRLQMETDLFNTCLDSDWGKKFDELNAIAKTIPSSWEFIHYTFLIENVTRAFTHQFVRTRTASFAQQSLRVVDARNFDYRTGDTIYEKSLDEAYKHAMENIQKNYKMFKEFGASTEDARGILPTNILTNIMMSCNLRTFVEMVRKRSSTRTQDEYRKVIERMKDVVLDVHPWVSLFIQRDRDFAIKSIENKITNSDLSKEDKLELIKLLDEIRSE